jgi:hypothetical protein
MPPNRREVAMLVLTDKATDVIRSIAERPEYPDTAGLRIAATSGDERLSAMPAENPEAGDQVRTEARGSSSMPTPPNGSMIRCSTP